MIGSPASVLCWLLICLAFIVGASWGKRRERARVEYQAQLKQWRESGHR